MTDTKVAKKHLNDIRSIEVEYKKMEQPKKMYKFIYYLMKEARRNSLMEFLEDREISEEEYKEIEKWFKKQLNIEL